MLVLPFAADDSLMLWSGRCVLIIDRDSRPISDDVIEFQLRKPRLAGTHAISIFTVAFYRRGKPMIALTSNTSVKVQHSSMYGTQAGYLWIRPSGKYEQ